MSLVRWDPMLQVDDMQARVAGLLGAGFPAGIAAAPIAVDVYETPEAYLVQAALPAIRAQDVQVEMRATELVIRANRLADAPEGATPLLRELVNGEFTRAITFPLPVAREEVSASFADGRLSVRLPKAPEARPRLIEVQAES